MTYIILTKSSQEIINFISTAYWYVTGGTNVISTDNNL